MRSRNSSTILSVMFREPLTTIRGFRIHTGRCQSLSIVGKFLVDGCAHNVVDGWESRVNRAFQGLKSISCPESFLVGVDRLELAKILRVFIRLIAAVANMRLYLLASPVSVKY